MKDYKMTLVKKIDGFIAKALHNTPLEYHVGDLAIDRRLNPDLDEAATHLMNLYQEGVIELFQRKDPSVGYRYIAVRQKKIRHARKFKGAYAQV